MRLLIYFTFLITLCLGADVYVDIATGNDEYTYTEAQSPNTPWANVSIFLSHPDVQSGDVCYVKAGTYSESLALTGDQSGKDLTVIGYTDTYLDGGAFTSTTGLTANDTFSNTTKLTIKNCRFTNAVSAIANWSNAANQASLKLQNCSSAKTSSGLVVVSANPTVVDRTLEIVDCNFAWSASMSGAANTHAVDIDGWASTTVSGSVISGRTDPNGINIFLESAASGSLTITNSTFACKSLLASTDNSDADATRALTITGSTINCPASTTIIVDADGFGTTTITNSSILADPNLAKCLYIAGRAGVVTLNNVTMRGATTISTAPYNTADYGTPPTTFTMTHSQITAAQVALQLSGAWTTATVEDCNFLGASNAGASAYYIGFGDPNVAGYVTNINNIVFTKNNVTPTGPIPNSLHAVYTSPGSDYARIEYNTIITPTPLTGKTYGLVHKGQYGIINHNVIYAPLALVLIGCDNIVTYNTFIGTDPNSTENYGTVWLLSDSGESPTNTRFHNNIIYNLDNANSDLVQAYCIKEENDGVNWNNWYENNIIYRARVAPFRLHSTTYATVALLQAYWLGSENVHKYNDTNTVIADPLFTDLANYNFTLQSNSPAIDPNNPFRVTKGAVQPKSGQTGWIRF